MTNYSIKKVSWDEILCLVDNIYNRIKQDNIKIDTLVPILRGGVPLSLLLTNKLEGVQTACIHIKRSVTDYTNSDFGKPTFLGITNQEQLTNKSILICEDIIDKGESLDLAISELEKYKPKNIYIATLFNFNNEKYNDVITGVHMKKYYWITFPWELEND